MDFRPVQSSRNGPLIDATPDRGLRSSASRPVQPVKKDPSNEVTMFARGLRSIDFRPE